MRARRLTCDYCAMEFPGHQEGCPELIANLLAVQERITALETGGSVARSWSPEYWFASDGEGDTR